jgi:hypothetical protein
VLGDFIESGGIPEHAVYCSERKEWSYDCRDFKNLPPENLPPKVRIHRICARAQGMRGIDKKIIN